MAVHWQLQKRLSHSLMSAQTLTWKTGYEELKNIQMNVATEEGIDAERVSDILHAGQMFLYICDTDF